MAEQEPNPTRDANGLPLCSEDACALYDGKRCRAIGFRPGTYCEPALVEIIAERDALKARINEYEDCSSISESTRERDGIRLVQNRPVLNLHPASVTTTIEQAPPDDLLDQTRCPHRRVSLRPDAHGNPETTCLDCGEPTNP